jgi:hypothetical protein
MINSRRMRGVEHVEHMGDMRNAYKILIRKPADKRPLRRLGIGRKMILEWILGK